MKRNKTNAAAYGEIIFDAAYLLFALVAGMILLIHGLRLPADGAQARTASLLFGAAALVLCFGDAFHLLPRIMGQLRGTMAHKRRALGRGMQITGITVTLFYLLLYGVWSRCLYTRPPEFSFNSELFVLAKPGVLLDVLAIALTIVRIVLCLLPQNGWTKHKRDRQWAILRNFPFFLLGLLVAWAFYFGSPDAYARYLFPHMSLAILLSFIFYVPVLLLVDRHPRIGMLMLPKTLMYVWMICMGLGYCL